MKQLIVIFITVLLLVYITACESGNTNVDENEAYSNSEEAITETSGVTTDDSPTNSESKSTEASDTSDSEEETKSTAVWSPVV